MNTTESQTQTPADAFVNFLCFILLASVGMASVGAVFIAAPLHQFYADQVLIESQKKHLKEMQTVYDEQQALIENKDNPSVLERAAIRQLKYKPADAAQTPPAPLTDSWQELEWALESVNSPEIPQTNKPYATYAKVLASQRDKRFILGVFGALLVLVALVCFNRKNYSGDDLTS